jgi:hypothetical protein
MMHGFGGDMTYRIQSGARKALGAAFLFNTLLSQAAMVQFFPQISKTAHNISQLY